MMMASSPTVREKLIAATSRLLIKEGLAKLTTRAVAREAGVAEGALYHHFAAKEELLVATIQGLVAPFAAIAAELPLRVGLGDVRATLQEVAVANYHFLLAATPIWGSLHADPALHARYLALVRAKDEGPHRALVPLTRYCAAEQRLGRVNPEADPQAVAELVMAVAHYTASLDNGMRRDPEDGPARVCKTLEAALVGLLPRGGGGLA